MDEGTRACANEQFVEEVHHVLQHLYDPMTLRSTYLATVLDLPEAKGPVALRDTLIQAIEALRPDPSTSDDAIPWRTYRTLVHRYIEQFTQREVADALSLSIRQMGREDKRAVVALADYIWVQHRVAAKQQNDRSTSVKEPSTAVASPSVEQELAWLGQTAVSEVIDPTHLVDRIWHVVQPLARALSVEVCLDMPTAPPSLMGPKDALRQAIINALSLAIRYAPGGRVTVSLQIEDPDVDLVVTSLSGTEGVRTDMGESAEVLEMVQGLLSLCGGSVALAWTDDACLRVTMHLAASPRRTVLLVDDNADAVELYRRFLQSESYAVDALSDPRLVLDRAISVRPDAIVLDVMLPGMDGWEVLERLREHPSTHHIPTIVCTILPDEPLAAALGAAGFLRKPVTRKGLLAALDRVLSPPQRGG